MPADPKSLLRRALGQPGVEIAVAQLDNAMTALADEMVVMLLAAEPITGLPGMVHQGVDHAALA
jgi:hypothetical protein